MALIYMNGGTAFAVREVAEEVVERMGKGPWLVVHRLGGTEQATMDGSIVRINPKFITAVADTGHSPTNS